MTHPIVRTLASAASVVACASTIVAEQPGDAAPRPLNICIIMAEDMGVQLGAYGDTTAPTPNIDRLAAEGVTFDRAYCTSATCSPSRSSFFTGLYPHQNGHVGLGNHYGYRMHEGIPTINQALDEAGYEKAVTYKVHVGPWQAMPWDTRFTWDYFRERGTYPSNVELMIESLGGWLDERDEHQPFFLMLNTNDTHRDFEGSRLEGHRPKVEALGPPYSRVTADDRVVLDAFPPDMPPRQTLHEDVARYYNAIQRFDWTVGRALDALEDAGVLDETLVVVTSDHGPAYSHGKLRSYELAMRIPMIVRWPGESRAGLRRDELVSMVDLSATILDAAGLEPFEHIAGRSLRTLLTEGEVKWRTHLFGEYHTHATTGDLWPTRIVWGPRYKLIHNLLAGSDGPGPPEAGDARGNIDLHTAREAHDDSAARAVYDLRADPPGYELYDLRDDPHEWHNIADDRGSWQPLVDLVGRLEVWRERTADPFLDEQYMDRFVAHYRAQEARVDAYLADHPEANEQELRPLVRGDYTSFVRAWPDVAEELSLARDRHRILESAAHEGPITASERPSAPRLSDRIEALLTEVAHHEPRAPTEIVVYKRVGERELTADLFLPNGIEVPPTGSPAIVLYHGGGLIRGSKRHFARQAHVLAEMGYIVALPTYRLLEDGITPLDITDDAADAFMWLVEHADRLGVDPGRIAIGGGSAGGYLAAAVSALPRCRARTGDRQPSALVLFNPVYDNGPGGFGFSYLQHRFREGSPAHTLHADMPPTLVMLGTEDHLVSEGTARRVQRELELLGVDASLKLFEGAEHGFFNAGKDGTEPFRQTFREMVSFLE
ncbi:MAG: sulfatase-like hydrolase/transferase [Planctomycetota bacterium]